MPTDGHAALARLYEERVLALIGHCPDGKALKLRDGARFLECAHRGGRAELVLKMGLRSDVTGESLLHARFRVVFASGDAVSLSLHALDGVRESAFFTKRQEQFLSAMIRWAEQVIPTASPVAPSGRTPPWQRDYAALYHHLSGRSHAVARRRLRQGFFADQADTPDTMRMAAFVELLREEGWVALVDHGEETVGAILDRLVMQRLPGVQGRSGVATSGHAIVALEDGSDHAVFAIVADDDGPTVARLIADLAPFMTLRR